MSLVDLSHRIEEGMVTYPGMPGPEFADYITRAQAEVVYGPGVTFHIGRITMVANTGTYLDSPYHRFENATDLAGLQLDQIADLAGVVIRMRASGKRDVEVADLVGCHVRGKAVLFDTGWDRHWQTPEYGVEAPFLSAQATEWLVEQGAALVGIDSVNIDDMNDKSRPAHSGLLNAGIPIVEHLCNLDQIPDVGFRFHAVPPAVRNFGTFPVRAYAIVS